MAENTAYCPCCERLREALDNCCQIGCQYPAEFAIFGASGLPEDHTDACTDHVGALLGTPLHASQDNRSWHVVVLSADAEPSHYDPQNCTHECNGPRDCTGTPTGCRWCGCSRCDVPPGEEPSRAERNEHQCYWCGSWLPLCWWDPEANHECVHVCGVGAMGREEYFRAMADAQGRLDGET